MKRFSIASIICLFNPARTISEDNRITGTFLGQNVNTTVDHELAAYYFKQSMDSSFHEPGFDTSLAHVMSTLQEDTVTDHDLIYLSNNVSVDFATLFFAREMYAIPKNHQAQDLFRKYLEYERKGQSMLWNTSANDYLYVFVPGLFYKRHSELGANFAAQLTLLKKMGLTTHLIETNEVGSVQKNAKEIAAELKILGQAHPKIVVVSASKGGPDLAFALGKLLSWEESKAIKAWISIGGVLRGSRIADQYLGGINRLYARIYLFFIGADIDLVEDLSQAKSIPRQNSLRFPDDLLIIHYVGAPLSGQLNKKVRKSFKMLSEMGPNDGLTTLVDQLTPQGIVITELGLDHYYNDPNIDQKGIALLYTALKMIDEREGSGNSD